MKTISEEYKEFGYFLLNVWLEKGNSLFDEDDVDNAVKEYMKTQNEQDKRNV